MTDSATAMQPALLVEAPCTPYCELLATLIAFCSESRYSYSAEPGARPFIFLRAPARALVRSSSTSDSMPLRTCSLTNHQPEGLTVQSAAASPIARACSSLPTKVVGQMFSARMMLGYRPAKSSVITGSRK